MGAPLPVVGSGPARPCVFCAMAARGTSDSGAPLLHSDDRVFAFHDRSPAAKVHILVCPRSHVEDCTSLSLAEERELVVHMRNVGQTLLSQLAPGADTVLGFHVPPFTSVPHLHLHCLALPWSASWRSVKDPDSTYLCGLRMPWFAPVDDILLGLPHSTT